MAVAALPAQGRRWGQARKLRAQAGAAAARLLQPAKPVLRNLTAIPFTVAGWACIAAGVFEVSTVAGLITGGVILMVLEHQIADED